MLLNIIVLAVLALFLVVASILCLQHLRNGLCSLNVTPVKADSLLECSARSQTLIDLFIPITLSLPLAVVQTAVARFKTIAYVQSLCGAVAHFKDPWL